VKRPENGAKGREMTMTTMTTSREATERTQPARRGMAPEPLTNGAPEDPAGPPRQSLHLTAVEVEVMLCFALSSPLHYGPVEDGLCDKLRRHLRNLYSRGSAHADL
jgi:hypothetical protein